MGWSNWSYKKKGLTIGAGVAIIIFAIFHLPSAVMLDNFFNSNSNMINEIHIVLLLFTSIMCFCLFVGYMIGKLLDVLKKYSKP